MGYHYTGSGVPMSPNDRVHSSSADNAPRNEESRRTRLFQSWKLQESASDYLALGVIKTLDVPCPLFLSEGQGAYVTDVDGNRYLDMLMGFGPHILGHRPPAVEAALKEQVDKGWHLGLNNNLQSELARMLIEANGGTGTVLFSGSGSEAIMYAMRVARAFTAREKIAVFDGSYHGSVDYALVGTNPSSPPDAPQMAIVGEGVPRMIAEDTMLLLPYRREAAFDVIAENATDLAGILVQPVQNSLPRLDNGPFLKQLRELCDSHGILLVFDEVVTGLRLAYGGGQELFGVRADLAAFGKIIGGGLPVGALWGRGDAMALFPRPNSEGGVFSSGTFNANPLTMSAGLAMMRHLSTHRATLYPRLLEMGQLVSERVNSFTNERQMRAQLMHAGSMLCLHFARGAINSSRDLPAGTDEANKAFFLTMLDKGILMPAGRLVFLSDAHQRDELDNLISAVTESLTLLQGRGLI